LFSYSFTHSNHDSLVDYQLVKLHHPDSPLCRSVPADVRHERFKAIKDAYDILRGKSASPRNPQMDELARRRRSSPDMDGRRWTGNHNEWGGFVYEDINATQPTHASWMSVERLFILIFGFVRTRIILQRIFSWTDVHRLRCAGDSRINIPHGDSISGGDCGSTTSRRPTFVRSGSAGSVGKWPNETRRHTEMGGGRWYDRLWK
jgi:hypothetical protein